MPVRKQRQKSLTVSNLALFFKHHSSEGVNNRVELFKLKGTFIYFWYHKISEMVDKWRSSESLEQIKEL